MFFISDSLQPLDPGFCIPCLSLDLGVPPFGMAKTKKQCLAMQRTDLHATDGTSGTPPVPPPPQKRIRTKQNADSAVSESNPGLPPFDLTWSNMKLIMEFYKLSERDATQLLLQVVGPDPNGETFWSRYADRIKQEQNQTPTEPLESATKKARVEPVALPALPPDNQLGDPELKAEYDGSIATEFDPDFECEGEGEEEADLSDDEIVAPGVSRSQDDDDQNSPNSGCVAAGKEVVETVCEPQPNPPAEPTRETVVVDQAAKDAKESFVRDTLVGSVPTPLTRKSGRYISRAIRLEEPLEDSMVGGMLLVLIITRCFWPYMFSPKRCKYNMI